LCRGLLCGGHCIVVDLLADRVLGQQRLVAGDVLLGARHGSHCGGELSVGVRDLCTVLARIDTVEQVVLLDEAAVLEGLGHQHAVTRERISTSCEPRTSPTSSTYTSVDLARTSITRTSTGPGAGIAGCRLHADSAKYAIHSAETAVTVRGSIDSVTITPFGLTGDGELAALPSILPLSLT
jgi:hypothetical protein